MGETDIVKLIVMGDGDSETNNYHNRPWNFYMAYPAQILVLTT
jgi:hypothetical protein